MSSVLKYLTLGKTKIDLTKSLIELSNSKVSETIFEIKNSISLKTIEVKDLLFDVEFDSLVYMFNRYWLMLTVDNNENLLKTIKLEFNNNVELSLYDLVLLIKMNNKHDNSIDYDNYNLAIRYDIHLGQMIIYFTPIVRYDESLEYLSVTNDYRIKKVMCVDSNCNLLHINPEKDMNVLNLKNLLSNNDKLEVIIEINIRHQDSNKYLKNILLNNENIYNWLKDYTYITKNKLNAYQINCKDFKVSITQEEFIIVIQFNRL